MVHHPGWDRHSLHNVAGEPARVLWQTRPALSTETHFETVLGLERDRKTTNIGALNLLQAAEIARSHDHEFRPKYPPRSVLRVLAAVRAPNSRFLGCKARHEECSGTEIEPLLG